jgi:hypothetical protein
MNLRHSGVGSVRDIPGGDAYPVEFASLLSDVPCVHRRLVEPHDLLVDAGDGARVLGDDPELELPVAIPRTLNGRLVVAILLCIE